MTSISRRAALMTAAAWAAPGLALAGAFPDRPVRIIVPFPPGGGTDTTGRIVAHGLMQDSGWNTIIENKPGAGGNIGLTAVAKAPADGLTLGLAQTANLAINPSLYRRMPYDALKDFAPVALVATQAMIVVVGGSSPYRSLAELVQGAKASAQPLTQGSSGPGTISHLAGVLFAKTAGIPLLHVPYQGAAPSLTGTMAGQIDINFNSPPSILPLLRTGKLRALAVTSAKRMQQLPEVPTVAEQGYPDYTAEDWKALVAPAGTPPEILKRLNAAVNAAIVRPATREQLVQEGSVPRGGSAEELGRLMEQQFKLWQVAVRESGARVD